MIFPIESIPIKITNLDDSVEFMTLEGPNGDNPFYFQVEEIMVRGKYRDRNNILRRGYTLYGVRWFYTYESHNMDLRKLLTAKEIDLAAPPDFKNGDYPTYPVRFVNQDVVKNYLGMPGGAATYASFDTLPSGNVTLEFELKNPIEWSDVLNVAWYESVYEEPPEPEPEPPSAPTNLQVTVDHPDAAFSWNAVAGVDGYNVYIDSGSGFVKHNETLIETNSYEIIGMETDEYTVHVKAVEGELESDASNEVEFLVNIWYTDFESETVDTIPSYMTRRWVTSGDGWTIKADGAATGGKVLRFTGNSGSERRALSWDSPGELQDAEIHFRAKFIDTDCDTRTMLRGSGSPSSETGYDHGNRKGNDAIRLHKYVSGSATTITSSSNSLSLGTWYEIKVQVDGENQRAKIWESGTAEPGWDLEGTDTSITASGWVGLFSFEDGDYDVDWIRVTKL